MKKIYTLLLASLFCLSGYSQKNTLTCDEHGHILPSSGKKYTTYNATVNGDGDIWTPVGPYGGDVLDLAIDPMNPGRVYAAAGYPFIRNSEEEPWEVIENLQMLANTDIHCFETNSDGIVFAGSNYYYDGIFKSDDSGETWTVLQLPVTAGVLNITIDPSDENIMYVVTTSNISVSQNKVIIKTDDQGATWTALDMTSLFPIGMACVDLAVDPDNSQTLFALGSEGISNAKAIASFDGGTSWQDVSNGLPLSRPFNEVTIANGMVYVSGGQLFGGNTMGLYKSENYGGSWQDISTGFPIKVVNDVLVHPDNAMRLFAATEGDGVYHTFNGGVTWNYETGGAGNNGSARKLAFHPDDPDFIYGGFLSLGVCLTENGGLQWSSSSVGIAALALNDIEVDPNDPQTILVSFEAENSGGCYTYDPDTEEWALVESLPGTRFSAVSIGIDGTMYAWSNGPTTVAAEGVYKSSDGGQTWTNMGPNIGTVFETQIFAMTLSEIDPDLIFIAGNNFGANGWESMIYRSADGGENWDNVFMGPANDGFKYIYIDPSSNDQVVYAAYKTESAGGGFIKSIDGGTNWLPINSGIPAATKWASAIINDPDNPDILYGGAGGYGGTPGTVYKSENGGSSWTAMNISLGNYSKITDLMLSPLNPDVIYAATSLNGVYLTEDGENWGPFNEGLPASNITGFSRLFEIDEQWGFYASTFTNSSYYSDLYDPGTIGTEEFSSDKKLVVYPIPTSGTIRIDLQEIRNPRIVKVFSTDGRLVKTYNTSGSVNSEFILHLDVDEGVYILSLETDKTVISEKILVK